MAIQQLRSSQLITTFGTGSMVDLPDNSVSSDAEGALGGLVNAVKRIRPILLNTIQNASMCSLDPVCSHTKPEENNPSHWLLVSACHCCTHLPETSCEQMNQFLDRSLVVPTLEGLGCEFFKLTGP